MGEGAETARLLGRAPIFAALTNEELIKLAVVAVPRSWPAGEAVFREGDDGDTCYLIRDGSVRVTRNHRDGRAITLAELRARRHVRRARHVRRRARARPPSRR